MFLMFVVCMFMCLYLLNAVVSFRVHFCLSVRVLFDNVFRGFEFRVRVFGSRE